MTTEPYPCTIIRDRYDGTYSGGAWTAWPRYEHEIPADASADDVTCAEFWYGSSWEGQSIGRGETPEKALRDLIERLSGH